MQSPDREHRAEPNLPESDIVSDVTIAEECFELVVVGQVASGIPYLIAAVPLLVSRIATFASP